jgi:pimeloyl-ACP methyl ester carboxylesterase
VNPIAFGTRARQLFGVFTPAAGVRAGEGIVICSPLGAEYQRAHRSLRILGDRLGMCGYDVLRFDYFGTGDSMGEGSDVTLDGAVSDTLVAIDELCAMAAVDCVTLVGVRFGALVAVAAAGRDARAGRMVLWDTLDAAAVATQLRQTQTTDVVGEHWNNGYPVSKTLLDELQAFEDSAFDVVVARPTLVIQGDVDPPASLRGIAGRNSWRGEWADFADLASWNRVHDLGSGAVPTRVFERIESWCR